MQIPKNISIKQYPYISTNFSYQPQSANKFIIVLFKPSFNDSYVNSPVFEIKFKIKCSEIHDIRFWTSTIPELPSYLNISK